MSFATINQMFFGLTRASASISIIIRIHLFLQNILHYTLVMDYKICKSSYSLLLKSNGGSSIVFPTDRVSQAQRTVLTDHVVIPMSIPTLSGKGFLEIICKLTNARNHQVCTYLSIIVGVMQGVIQQLRNKRYWMIPSYMVKSLIHPFNDSHIERRLLPFDVLIGIDLRCKGSSVTVVS